jgi:hypothetical protein
VFHSRCKEGIEALEQYRREWNDEAKTFRASAVHDWCSHYCLTADTLVLTEDGERRIDGIAAGDRVWTPAGLARVLATSAPASAVELIEIKCADGRILRGTPHHKVFTARGVVPLDALRYSDVLLSEDSALWQNALSYSRDENIGFRDAITALKIGAPDHRASIGRFGKTLTVPFRRAARFIISMATASIMSLPIFKPLSQPLTFAGMHGSGLKTANCALPMNWLSDGPLNGTALRRDSSGTRNMAKPLGKLGSGILASAKNAIASLCRLIRREPNSVTSIARWRPCVGDEAGQLVYDLTVEKHHCYLANGILVGNSDAFRYLALSRHDEVRKVIRRPQIRSGLIIPPPREYPTSRGMIF